MIAALLLSVAAPTTALESERAYAEAIRTTGRRAAARKFGVELFERAEPDAEALAQWPVIATLAAALKPTQAWLRASLRNNNNAERRPELLFVSCQATGPAVIVGSLVKDGRRVGTFKTVWSEDGHGWRWKVDQYTRADPSPAKLSFAPRIVKPDCAQPPTLEQRSAAAVANLEALGGAEPADDTDVLAVQHRNAADDVIVSDGVSWSQRRLPSRFPSSAEVGLLPMGDSDDGTLSWSGWLLDPATGAHSFTVEQWRGPHKGSQVVYFELNGVAVP